MKTNPDKKQKVNDKGKTIFEEEYDLKISARNSKDKTTPLRAKRGWVWIQKGATFKQVNKDKLDAYLKDEWKLLNK